MKKYEWKVGEPDVNSCGGWTVLDVSLKTTRPQGNGYFYDQYTTDHLPLGLKSSEVAQLTTALKHAALACDRPLTLEGSEYAGVEHRFGPYTLIQSASEKKDRVVVRAGSNKVLTVENGDFSYLIHDLLDVLPECEKSLAAFEKKLADKKAAKLAEDIQKALENKLKALDYRLKHNKSVVQGLAALSKAERDALCDRLDVHCAEEKKKLMPQPASIEDDDGW